MELRGEVVVLRAVGVADVAALASMFAEPAVAQWWPGYDRARVEREFLHDEDPLSTRCAVVVDGAVVGAIQCTEEADPEYKAAWIDIAIATAWHGRGVAVDALRTLARYLIDQRGHHHLFIDPAVDNARAIACYSKVGFRRVGVMRQNERGADGRFHDSLLMDLLAGELT